jgi:hypothetical protein
MVAALIADLVEVPPDHQLLAPDRQWLLVIDLAGYQ